ncbi:MAG: hypothetical protein ABS81_31075 [Pseudonocardia sp. SCN 72-86]|nr:MAG: hypothetical protein ABS81_31075 [Pseudonocardia sp. SCN 72-86]
MWTSLTSWLPRGRDLPAHEWGRRHRFLIVVLLLHVPALVVVGLVVHAQAGPLALGLAPVVVLAAIGWLLRAHRRPAAIAVTAGLVYCSAVLVVLTHGTIESHFHFFIVIGFTALYQDWAPFLFNILFTFLSHGIGSAFAANLIFDHESGIRNPWLWSAVHAGAVLLACVGVLVFWRLTEDQQQEKEEVARRLTDLEIGRRQFTSDLLVNLARRNQSMLYRQLEIINELEEHEHDPDTLAELFRLDHLATRVRRNAESLFVLSGEQPARVWSQPVPLRDVVRAAIAETEDLDRVVFTVDERPAVLGHIVTDLTHLLAELAENAVRYSPPDTAVTIRQRLDRRPGGGHLLTVEDWGVGMPAAELEAANSILAQPPEVDLSVAQRLGLHVVSRLATRHGIVVSLGTTPGSGLTAVVSLPPELFVAPTGALPRDTVTADVGAEAVGRLVGGRPQRAEGRPPRPTPRPRTEPVAVLVGPSVDGTVAPEASAVPPIPVLPRRDTAHRNGFPAGPEPDSANGSGNGHVLPRGAGNWRGWWEPASGMSSVAEPTPLLGLPAVTPADADAPSLRAVPDLAAGGPDVPATDGAETTGNADASDVPGVPAQRGAVPAQRITSDARPALRRRVPQANLAPELRQGPGPAAGANATPAVPPASAAQALSRYQASRRAAQAETAGPPTGHTDDPATAHDEETR